MNDIDDALIASERVAFGAVGGEVRRTKADFIQTLRILGARVLKPFFVYERGRAPRSEIRVAVLSCRLRTWRAAFGQPAHVVECRDVATNMPFQTWEQKCRDGKITCVGHLFERVPGGPWVILARVCLS